MRCFAAQSRGGRTEVGVSQSSLEAAEVGGGAAGGGGEGGGEDGGGAKAGRAAECGGAGGATGTGGGSGGSRDAGSGRRILRGQGVLHEPLLAAGARAPGAARAGLRPTSCV